jgi:hypothetical protein
MNLPPKPRKLALPVSGARIGSLARPVADGVATPLAKPRFGLRAHASRLPLGPLETPTKDDEVA